eukprot:2467716-Pyramimonas_sp.AAC.1
MGVVIGAGKMGNGGYLERWNTVRCNVLLHHKADVAKNVSAEASCRTSDMKVDCGSGGTSVR